MKKRQLINWSAYIEEDREMELLNDREEAEIREKMLEEIFDKVADYQLHVNEYEYLQYCKTVESRGLRYRQIAKKTVVKKWEKYFATELSPEVKKEIYYRMFKWHMFSYEKIPAKEGTKASQAFNRIKKNDAYLFFQHANDAWYIENADLLKAKDLKGDYRTDVYIFDAKGKWAYVCTHEINCGPYFLLKK